jgi:ribosomal protein L12E/L44/L45/RPP1/RPP2
MEDLVEFFELYEKIKVSYMNVFYRIPPSKEELKAIKQQCNIMVKEMQAEMQVKALEQQQQMQEAVEAGKMLPERFQLEMQKAQKMMQQQLQAYAQECMSKLQAAESRIENTIITEKEFKLLNKDKTFQKNLIEAIQFYDTRVKQTCCVGDQILYENVFHNNVKEYPIVPIHYKWTGTPYPISAVSPLIGKQQEINKAHQIMVHNASLGSSLRWMYEEGSIDAELWEKYSASPGALLPIRPGVERPTPVMPAPLANAFFQIVQEAKGDMEYLAGIYSS